MDSQQSDGDLAFEGVSDRTQYLDALLYVAEPHLANPAVFSVHGNCIRGQVASTSTGIDRERVREQSIALGVDSVLVTAAKSGRLYSGPVAPDDPLRLSCEADLCDIAGIAVIPITVGPRTVCLLVGHPVSAEPELEASLASIGRVASSELAGLIKRTRDHTSSFPVPDVDPQRILRIRTAKNRAQLQELVLETLFQYVGSPAIYVVHSDDIRGVAGDDSAFARTDVSLAWRCVDRQELQAESLAPSDPLAAAYGTDDPIVIVPVTVRDRTALLLVGRARRAATASLKLALAMVAFETGMAVTKLTVASRRFAPKPPSRGTIVATVAACVAMVGVAAAATMAIQRADVPSIEEVWSSTVSGIADVVVSLPFWDPDRR